MICALLDVFSATGAAACLERAGEVFDHIHTVLAGDGELHACASNGVPQTPALLRDYAALGLAYSRMYSATGDAMWLEMAQRTAKLTHTLLSDGDDGMFMCRLGEPPLFMRPKDTYDAELPSGNSLYAAALQSLCALRAVEGSQQALNEAMELRHAQFSFMAKCVKEQPLGESAFACALLHALDEEQR